MKYRARYFLPGEIKKGTTFSVTRDELAWLDSLAKEYDVSRSKIIEMALNLLRKELKK